MTQNSLSQQGLELISNAQNGPEKRRLSRFEGVTDRTSRFLAIQVATHRTIGAPSDGVLIRGPVIPFSNPEIRHCLTLGDFLSHFK